MATKHVVAGAGAGAALMAAVWGTAIPTIQGLEGTKAVAYRDIVGVLTVCTGHTGPDVVVNKVYSSNECAALTQKDASKAADGVLKVSPHLIWHPMQLAAAISFSYNVGTGAYSTSSVANSFNTGDYSGGCSAMLKYTIAGGKFSQGLANRRQQEYTICTSTLTVKGFLDADLASTIPK